MDTSDVVITVSLTIGGVLVGVLATLWVKARKRKGG